jgi:uncharacterized phage-associated protein
MANKGISALNVALYFIFTAEKAQRRLTNKKLQKLLYYAQAWSLALRGMPMFKEDIEAWIHGPVVPNVYHHYKKFGSGLLEEKTKFDPVAISQHIDILDEVWRVYGKYDADYLELLTHNEDPWIHARNEIDSHQASTVIISHELMRSFYMSLLQKATPLNGSKTSSS